MSGWRATSTFPVTLARTNRLAEMYVLSPYVWREGDRFRILVRAVPRREDDPRLKMSEVWHGSSSDGRHFDMDIAPTIFPGPELVDLDGCEDPTVRVDGGTVRVWYTGYNYRQQAGRLLLARGPSVEALSKAGLAIDSDPTFNNPKEPSIVSISGGRWRMFFEYAAGDASRIGQAEANNLDGPWGQLEPSPIEPRPEHWDSWHFSAGPVVGDATARPTMFYNGADKDARWRIGWATFDKNMTRVIDRCDAPVIDAADAAPGGRDMAFAASAVDMGEEGVLIYHSVSDQDLRCTLIERY